MSTIFTDELCGAQVSFEIEDPRIGYAGRELCISAGNGTEIRLVLTEQQLIELVDQIELAGIERGAQ